MCPATWYNPQSPWQVSHWIDRTSCSYPAIYDGISAYGTQTEVRKEFVLSELKESLDFWKNSGHIENFQDDTDLNKLIVILLRSQEK